MEPGDDVESEEDQEEEQELEMGATCDHLSAVVGLVAAIKGMLPLAALPLVQSPVADPVSGVAVKDRVYHARTYEGCFVGAASSDRPSLLSRPMVMVIPRAPSW